MLVNKIGNFMNVYFANRDKYTELNKYEINGANGDAYMAIFDIKVARELLKNSNIYANYHNLIYNYTHYFISGEQSNLKFDLDRLNSLSHLNYPLEFISHIENCIDYYFDPLRALPTDYDINSLQHNSYSTIKIIQCLCSIYLEQIKYEHFITLAELGKKYNIPDRSKLNPDYFYLYITIRGQNNQEDLLLLVSESEKLYKLYGELSDPTICKTNLPGLKRICKKYQIKYMSKDKRIDIEKKIRNYRGY